MARYVMVVDTTKCVECYACRVACQAQNSLPPDKSFNQMELRESGLFPHVKAHAYPLQCQHCDNPPCQHVCPTNATYKRPDGVVLVDPKKCIGCKYCMTACPYQARIFNADQVAEKCRLCVELLEQGIKPACESTCMCNVRTSGDLDDLKSPVHALLANKKTVTMRPDQGTKPRLYYIV